MKTKSFILSVLFYLCCCSMHSQGIETLDESYCYIFQNDSAEYARFNSGVRRFSNLNAWKPSRFGQNILLKDSTKSYFEYHLEQIDSSHFKRYKFDQFANIQEVVNYVCSTKSDSNSVDTYVDSDGNFYSEKIIYFTCSRHGLYFNGNLIGKYENGKKIGIWKEKLGLENYPLHTTDYTIDYNQTPAKIDTLNILLFGDSRIKSFLKSRIWIFNPHGINNFITFNPAERLVDGIPECHSKPCTRYLQFFEDKVLIKDSQLLKRTGVFKYRIKVANESVSLIIYQGLQIHSFELLTMNEGCLLFNLKRKK